MDLRVGGSHASESSDDILIIMAPCCRGVPLVLPGPLLRRLHLGRPLWALQRDEAVPHRHRDHRGDPALRDNPPQLHQVWRGKAIWLLWSLSHKSLTVSLLDNSQFSPIFWPGSFLFERLYKCFMFHTNRAENEGPFKVCNHGEGTYYNSPVIVKSSRTFV